MRKEKEGSSLLSFNHINAFIVTKLKGRLQSYDDEDRYKLMDYLCEWSSLYSERKHLVELIRERIERNKKNESKYRSEELYGYTLLLFNAVNSPERIMEYLLGEREWQDIQDRIAHRSPLDQENVKSTLEKAIEESILEH